MDIEESLMTSKLIENTVVNNGSTVSKSYPSDKEPLNLHPIFILSLFYYLAELSFLKLHLCYM